MFSLMRALPFSGDLQSQGRGRIPQTAIRHDGFSARMYAIRLVKDEKICSWDESVKSFVPPHTTTAWNDLTSYVPFVHISIISRKYEPGMAWTLVTRRSFIL